MTGAEIVTQFETLVNDSLDSTFVYQLLNNAKNEIEGLRDWEMLKKKDSSNSATSSAIALPSDWRKTLWIYVGTYPYHQIPFDQSSLLSDAPFRWYLDLVNSNFYLLGNSLSGTVNHFYIKQTDDITSSTSPVWPARYHSIIAYRMAKIFYAVDQGEKGMAWDDRWEVYEKVLLNSMIDWDVDLQKRTTENRLPEDTFMEYPLSLM